MTRSGGLPLRQVTAALALGLSVTALAAAPAGRPALTDVHGARRTVEDLRGKGAALLWFTNLCDTCQAAIPALDSLTRTLAGLPVTVIGVSFIKDDRERVAGLLAAHHPAFPLLLDPGGAVTEAYTGLKAVDACPVVNALILDRKGRVVFKGHYPGTDPADLERRLRKAAGRT